MNTLCDTPEALSRRGAEHTEVKTIFEKVKELSDNTGIMKITLTGGDPLWNAQDQLTELFTLFAGADFDVTVETSGTLSWLPYTKISSRIYWVLDYKLQSAGVKNPEILFFDDAHLENLRPNKDYIKFVVYDDKDFTEMEQMVHYLAGQCKATLTVGVFWGGYIDSYQLFNKLIERKLIDKVQINFQTHKLAFAPNYNLTFPTDI